MSLRMNLYGWSLPDFKQVLGSNDAAVLETASAQLAESVKEPALSKAQAWLRTLIERGYPLRADRQPPPESTDGGLLTVHMETEAHVFAVDSLISAIARDEHLDLSQESSSWSHPAVGSLYNELSACGFTKSPHNRVEYFTWMLKLSEGSSLFGDDFRTTWAFYTWFTNQDLATMLPVFQAAADFQRPLPKDCPDDVAKTIKTSLSDDGRKFIGDLIQWFSQIQRAGQDAFILWW